MSQRNAKKRHREQETQRLHKKCNDLGEKHKGNTKLKWKLRGILLKSKYLKVLEKLEELKNITQQSNSPKSLAAPPTKKFEPQPF